jgi:hypothetical protein
LQIQPYALDLQEKNVVVIPTRHSIIMHRFRPCLGKLPVLLKPADWQD